jgi:hypothetical protein
MRTEAVRAEIAAAIPAYGDRVRLRNEFGTHERAVLIADVAAGTIETHWPEGNVPVNPRAGSPLAKIPAYKEFWASAEPATATAELEPVTAQPELAALRSEPVLHP